MNRVALFAHYDPDDVVDPYVYFYLESLLTCVNRLVFVSVSEIPARDASALEAMGIELRLRSNVGHDFGSYKAGLSALDINAVDELLLCNDSVYGPLHPLQEMFTQMEREGGDFWGSSSCLEIAWHVQSYFLLLRRSVLESEVFMEFWETFTPLAEKQDIIKYYEVGFSQRLLEAGFIGGSYVGPASSQERATHRWKSYWKRFRERYRDPQFYRNLIRGVRKGVLYVDNPLQDNWSDLVVEKRFPFIKVQVLRDKSGSLEELGDLEALLGSVSEYPLALIRSHLERVTPGA